MIEDCINLRFSLNNRQCIWRVAHRGGKQENKLSGFKTAIDEGCNMIECDLRLSVEDIPVIIHDKTINRTTNGNGFVSKLKVNELQYYGVPSLADFLIWISNQKQTFVAFEIKDIGVKTMVLLNKTLSLLQEHRFVESSMIISFNKEIILTCKDLCPQVVTGITFHKTFLNNPFIIASKVKADTIWVHHKLLSTVMAHNVNNIPIFVWTVNDKKDIRGIDKNVAGIVSDNLSLLYVS